jgi:hypothetical protein
MARTRRLALGCLLAGIPIVGVTLLELFSIHAHNQAIALTRDWARLAPFPPSATHLQVDVKGTMFTRTFVITFDAPQADIDDWLARSPGIQDAERSRVDDDAKADRYVITPHEAQYAEVIVNPLTHHVRIRAYWS